MMMSDLRNHRTTPLHPGVPWEVWVRPLMGEQINALSAAFPMERGFDVSGRLLFQERFFTAFWYLWMCPDYPMPNFVQYRYWHSRFLWGVHAGQPTIVALTGSFAMSNQTRLLVERNGEQRIVEQHWLVALRRGDLVRALDTTRGGTRYYRTTMKRLHRVDHDFGMYVLLEPCDDNFMSRWISEYVRLESTSIIHDIYGHPNPGHSLVEHYPVWLHYRGMRDQGRGCIADSTITWTTAKRGVHRHQHHHLWFNHPFAKDHYLVRHQTRSLSSAVKPMVWHRLWRKKIGVRPVATMQTSCR